MANEVLSKNADGSYSFRAPVTAGDTGISADFTNFIDGGKPQLSLSHLKSTSDGGTIMASIIQIRRGTATNGSKSYTK